MRDGASERKRKRRSSLDETEAIVRHTLETEY